MWRQLSFCLGLFAYADRSTKKLVEGFDLYKIALNDEQTQSNFESLANKCTRALKEGAEDGDTVREWAKKIVDANIRRNSSVPAIDEEGEEDDLGEEVVPSEEGEQTKAVVDAADENSHPNSVECL